MTSGISPNPRDLSRWSAILKDSKEQRMSHLLTIKRALRESPSMRRPAAKARKMGRSKGIQSLSEAEKASWYERIDAIRQARVPKPKKPAFFPPSIAEVQEEFA